MALPQPHLEEAGPDEKPSPAAAPLVAAARLDDNDNRVAEPEPPRAASKFGGNTARRRLHQKVMFGLMTGGMLLVLLPTLLVFGFIFAKGWRQIVLSDELRPSSLTNPALLAQTLQGGSDPVSRYLNRQFKGDAKQKLDAYDNKSVPPAALQTALRDMLNEQIRGTGLYDKERFAAVRLSPGTRKLLATNKKQLDELSKTKSSDPFGLMGSGGASGNGGGATNSSSESMVALNRALLEDAYPNLISRSRFTLAFLTDAPLDNGLRGGIGPAIVGTFALMIGTVLLSLPLGVFAAIYLTEYARKGPMIRLVRMAIVNLAGVPSIVHGLFGLGLFIYFFGAKLDQLLHNDRPVWQNQTLLWGASTLAVLVLPIVITATEEALLSVPRSFREGSLGLGATKWQTIRRVVLPSAVPGILTGAILAVGRAAGETAPILLTAAVSWTSRHGIPKPNEPVMALPYHLYYVVTQVANAPDGLRYGIALTLLTLVFLVNLSAILLRARLRRNKRW